MMFFLKKIIEHGLTYIKSSTIVETNDVRDNFNLKK